MRAKQRIDIWYDADYETGWTVSLCDQNGEEVRCLGSFGDDETAARTRAANRASEFGVRANLVAR